MADDLFDAVGAGLDVIPDASDCAKAMRLGVALARAGDGPGEIHGRYRELSPVHTVNNLALVVCGLRASALVVEADEAGYLGGVDPTGNHLVG